MAEAAKWYVVQTYSGYEGTVQSTIERTVESRNLQELIHQVVIPIEKVTEIVDGKTKEIERKIFPSYVLVKMVMTDATWYVIRNIRGVTGFVGSGGKPTPLTEDEVLALGVEKREIVVNYAVGDTILIQDGPLTNFKGVVDAIDLDNKKVRVVVSMFGRETPVELDLDQVEKVPE